MLPCVNFALHTVYRQINSAQNFMSVSAETKCFSMVDTNKPAGKCCHLFISIMPLCMPVFPPLQPQKAQLTAITAPMILHYVLLHNIYQHPLPVLCNCQVQRHNSDPSHNNQYSIAYNRFKQLHYLLHHIIRKSRFSHSNQLFFHHQFGGNTSKIQRERG